MTHVLLINPRICSTGNMRMPLSLLALAAVLKGKYEFHILDGNLIEDLPAHTLALLSQLSGPIVAGISVMPGPQIAPAIEISMALRAARPDIFIVWGGYFPSMYADAAINAPYVDFVVRGQGEESLLELLALLPEAGLPLVQQSAQRITGFSDILGLTWKNNGQVVHNAARPFRHPDHFPALPYENLPALNTYLRPTFMNTRTAVHQAAIGCRYHCRFCGVVSVYDGHTQLQGPDRVLHALSHLRDRFGANGIQFYDNNFFDSERSSIPLLEGLSHLKLPWWCYARADTLVKFSPQSWELLKRSQLRMAYIGAEAASDSVLRSMKKGTKVEQTLEVAAKCREIGVIPEFSFVLGGPEDPEGEIERTLSFIKKVKTAHPSCEVILYFYSPTPQRDRGAGRAATVLPQLDRYGPEGPTLPTTPEEWAQPKWVSFVCHQDAPWLSPRIRRRVQDFARVLACRFPTVQDHRIHPMGKSLLRHLAGWRYRSGIYGHSWELELATRLIPIKRPDVEGL